MMRVLALWLALVFCVPASEKVRLVVMTDISTLEAGSGEPDDTQSLVRLLLFSNEFDLEGLIATHTTHPPNHVNPEFIRKIVETYGKVRDNLVLHDPAYPAAAQLLARIKAGSLDRSAIGAGRDSEGSDWLISVADKPDTRPLWIVAWGGTRELAQALWKVRETRDAAHFAAFESRLRVYAVYDQDGTGKWIKANHPDLFYIEATDVVRGMYRGGNPELVSPEWVEEHVRNRHGALGAAYPNYNGGDPWGKVRGIKEGDTPSFLYLIPNGLGDPQHADWGSWGGRFKGGPRHFEGDADADGVRATVYRWRPAYQNAFQARLDWCVKGVREANHEPVAVLDGSAERTVRSGEIVNLSAKRSRDPDGDRLSYDWSFYKEPSSYKGELAIAGARLAKSTFVAPQVRIPSTIHMVLTVTDDGVPPLSRYRRIVIHILPVVKMPN